MHGIHDLTESFSFMPHGHCYQWIPGLVALHAISDSLIGAAYFAISLILYGLIRSARLPFSWLILAFGVFIGACGLTHWMEVANVWNGFYWTAGGIKALTAAASVGTGLLLIPARSRVLAIAEASVLLEKHRVELETKNAELLRLTEQVRALAKEQQRQSESREAKALAQLKLAFQAARSGSFEVDLVAQRTSRSEELVQFLGLDGPAEGPVDQWLEHVVEEDRPRAKTDFAKHLAAGKGTTEFRIRRPNDGVVRWMEARGIVLSDAEGRPERMVGVVTDITERKLATLQLQESYALLDTLFSASPVGLAVWDRDLRYLRINESLAEMNGLTAEAHLGRTVPEVLPGLPNIVPMFREVIEHGKRFVNQEVRGTTAAKGGETRSWLASYYPLRYPTGEIFGMAGVVVDMTELRQTLEALRLAREALETANHQLEARVRQRTAELAAANQELEAFSYSVSHDLRAPLRALDGFSQVLLEEHTTQLDDEGRELLTDIRTAAQRMAQLIDDLLRLSRVTREPLHLNEVDLSALAHSVIDRLQRAEPERRVTIQIEEGLKARGDERLLRVAIENLLANAWKFSRQAADATVSFGRERVDGEEVYSVRDNGAGFDTAFAHKLFTPFQRLHSDAEFPGTGVGLATVQRVVRRHGGRAWARSGRNEGEPRGRRRRRAGTRVPAGLVR